MASIGAAPSSAALLRGDFLVGRRRLSWKRSGAVGRKVGAAASTVRAKQGGSALEYKKLGDSDLTISEIMLGTVRLCSLNRRNSRFRNVSFSSFRFGGDRTLVRRIFWIYIFVLGNGESPRPSVSFLVDVSFTTIRTLFLSSVAIDRFFVSFR